MIVQRIVQFRSLMENRKLLDVSATETENEMHESFSYNMCEFDCLE